MSARGAQRLRRVDCSRPGLTRIRRGRGFSYVDTRGEPITDPDEVLRLKQLAIPPAWTGVWICPDPLGHLQATGVDAAGRKQYLYHPRWRERQDRRKFDRMLEFAALLPGLRRRVRRALNAGDQFDERRVLACALRLLDVGLFRVGGEQYADDEGGIGLATLPKRAVTVRDGEAVFDYVGKAGRRHVQVIRDAPAVAVVAALRRRRSGGDELLAYRAGRRWHPVGSEQINDRLKANVGDEHSAKDFRTWGATVLAAATLAGGGRDARSARARQRAIREATRTVAETLGNTPAVARRAYIDPRVFDRYLSGWTIGGELDRGRGATMSDRRRNRLEAAVIDLLRDDRGSPAVAHDVGR